MYQRFVKHVLKIEDDVEDFFNDMNNYCGGPFTDYPSILFDHEMETLQRLRQDGYRLAGCVQFQAGYDSRSIVVLPD